MELYKYMDKHKKNDRYSELMQKLKSSIQEEFYYESIFIIYAILEDRTESLLRHANISITKNTNQKFSLSEKLDKIKKDIIFQNDYVKKHLTNEFMQQISHWKHKRNLLMHELVNIDYHNEEIEELALDGYELIKILNNKSTLVNKYNDKSLLCKS